jgi:hypothetical protein
MEYPKKLGPNFSTCRTILVDLGVNSHRWLVVIPHFRLEGVEGVEVALGVYSFRELGGLRGGHK